MVLIKTAESELWIACGLRRIGADRVRIASGLERSAGGLKRTTSGLQADWSGLQANWKVGLQVDCKQTKRSD